MYKHGNTYGSSNNDLYGVGDSFISFLKEYDRSTPQWFLVNDRMNSFYGSTFKIYTDSIKYQHKLTSLAIIGDDLCTPKSINSIDVSYDEKTYWSSLIGSEFNVFNNYSNIGYRMINVKESFINNITKSNKPDILLINGGYNDIIYDSSSSVDTIYADYKFIVEKCLEWGIIPLIFISPTKLEDVALQEKIDLLINKLKNIADEFNHNLSVTIKLFDLRNTELYNNGIVVKYYQSNGWKFLADAQSFIVREFDYCYNKAPYFFYGLFYNNNDTLAIGDSFIGSYLDLGTDNSWDKVVEELSGVNITVVPNKSNIDEINTYFDNFMLSAISIPDRVMFTGYNNIILSDTDNTDEILNKYKSFTDKLLTNGITPIIMLLPQPTDYINGELKPNIELFIHKLKEYVESKNKINMYILDFYDSNLCTANVLNYSYVYSDGEHYTKDGNSILGNYVLENFYIKSGFSLIYHRDTTTDDNVPHFYLSIQYADIREDTYKNWLFNTEDNYMNESFDRTYDYDNHSSSISYKTISKNTGGTIVGDYYSHKTVNIVSKYDFNIFKNTGEALFIGIHTLFDDGLWMCEQGGITCEKEARLQENTMNLLPYRTIVTTGTTSYTNGNKTDEKWQEATEGDTVTPLIYPGMGCPMLTISDDDKIEYNVNINGITYYFTRNKYNATITTNIHNSTVDNDLWQSITLGMLDCYDIYSYKFPLYIGGGTSGLSQDIWVYTAQNDKYPTYLTGNSIDLSMHNIALSNSNILNSTRFNGSDVSNFRILSPSGEWQNIYINEQNAIVKPYHTCGGVTMNWAYPLDTPLYDMDNYNTIYPRGNDSTKIIDTYTITNDINKFSSSTPLNNIYVILNSIASNKETGIYGNIPYCYSVWSRTLCTGIIEINGRNYLCIPNGWEGRLWKYRDLVGVYTEWDNNLLRETYDKIHMDSYNYKIYNYLLLEVGD